MDIGVSICVANQLQAKNIGENHTASLRVTCGQYTESPNDCRFSGVGLQVQISSSRCCVGNDSVHYALIRVIPRLYSPLDNRLLASLQLSIHGD